MTELVRLGAYLVLQTRLMQEADLAAGDRLTRFAGWNQRNKRARTLLQRHDFFPVRRLVRMFRGPNAFPGRPEEVYCLAGFECVNDHQDVRVFGHSPLG